MKPFLTMNLDLDGQTALSKISFCLILVKQKRKIVLVAVIFYGKLHTSQVFLDFCFIFS